MKEAFKQAIIELIQQAFGSISSWLVSISFSLALVGGAISVLLYVAGWSKGMRCTGILVVAHILFRTILG